MDGRRIYAPELIDIVYEEETENPLTDRESEVLGLVAKGKQQKRLQANCFYLLALFETIYQQF